MQPMWIQSNYERANKNVLGLLSQTKLKETIHVKENKVQYMRKKIQQRWHLQKTFEAGPQPHKSIQPDLPENIIKKQ